MDSGFSNFSGYPNFPGAPGFSGPPPRDFTGPPGIPGPPVFMRPQGFSEHQRQDTDLSEYPLPRYLDSYFNGEEPEERRSYHIESRDEQYRRLFLSFKSDFSRQTMEIPEITDDLLESVRKMVKDLDLYYTLSVSPLGKCTIVHKKLDGIMGGRYPVVSLTPGTQTAIYELLKKAPVDRFDFKRLQQYSYRRPLVTGYNVNKLCPRPLPKIPRAKSTNALQEYRESLPLWLQREKILNLIREHRVTVVISRPGAGKLTQVPQYILDEAREKQESARIVCSVPKKLAAITKSMRVATERGERHGDTVGFQVRLESVISPSETLLTYCTHDVFLRSLCFANCFDPVQVTHIIVGEYEIGNMYQDFLISRLRVLLVRNPNLRLIIMGVSVSYLEIEAYFTQPGLSCAEFNATYGPMACPIVLHEENFKTLVESTRLEQELVEDCMHMISEAFRLKDNIVNAFSDDSFRDVIDGMLQSVLVYGDEKVASILVYYTVNGVVPVNYMYYGMSVISVCIINGYSQHVKTLLQLESYKDPVWHDYFKSLIRCKAFERPEIENMLLEVVNGAKRCSAGEECPAIESIDFIYLMRILSYAHTTYDFKSSILIFLPSYQEIKLVMSLLTHCTAYNNYCVLPRGTFVIHLVHEDVASEDIRAAYAPPEEGIRRIILTTEIGETSITFPNTNIVIDCGQTVDNNGRHCRVTYSSANIRALCTMAGPPVVLESICFRTYSRDVALRTNCTQHKIAGADLQSLCLLAKAMSMASKDTADVLIQSIPNAPPPESIKQAIQELKYMTALTNEESLTTLGCHILEIPIEPRWAKALIYGVILKCLDPILTIVACQDHIASFSIPESDPSAARQRPDPVGKSFSDHLSILYLFYAVEDAASTSRKEVHKICSTYGIPPSCFEVIYATRVNLLAQLRASGFVNNKGPSDLLDLNINSKNEFVVKAALTAALFPNVGVVGTNNIIVANGGQQCGIFRSKTYGFGSEVRSLPSEIMIYNEIVPFGNIHLVKVATCIDIMTLILFGCQTLYPPKEDSNTLYTNLERPATLRVNDWLIVYGEHQELVRIYYLRTKFEGLVTKRLENPKIPVTQIDSEILQVVVTAISEENARINFPTRGQRISRWPRFAGGNLLSIPTQGLTMAIPSRIEHRRPPSFSS